MSRIRPSIGLLALAALAAVPAAAQTHDQQKDPNRPAGPIVQAPDEVLHDMSWYPHAERPPFVSTSIDSSAPEDALHLVNAGNATFLIDDEPTIPAALSKPLFQAGQFVPGYFIVHFEAPITRQHKQRLDVLAGRLVSADGRELSRAFVPGNGTMVWVRDARQLRRLRNSPQVDWVGRYQPAYKLDPRIGSAPLSSPERLGRALFRLNVELMPGHPMGPVADALSSMGASVIARVDLPGKRTHDVRFLVVEAPPALVTHLATVEGVRMIQESGDGLATHDLSGGGKLQNRSLSADDQSASPIVTTGAYPLWRVNDLQGQGQLIGVVDTNIDWNNTGVSGCGFGFPDTAIDNWGFALPNLSKVLIGSVGSGGVNLKIPRSDQLGGAQLGSATTNEHGMAVSGAALGDFYGNNDTKWWEHDVDTWEGWAPANFSGLLGPGIAHEAQLFFTPILNSAGAFRWEFAGEFPANMDTTLGNMAAAGACATVHSTGIVESSNTYTQTSVVHDTNGFDHPDMLQCMAAGNSGAVANALTSQAVVKNALSVGASDDVLRPEDRVTFSSIGPRFDGAIKPDVMAPGNDTAPRDSGISSLLILPQSNGTGSGSCAYQYTSGTSFSAPTMAGAVALVHQYFQEGRYAGSVSITDPSAALMKSMLINAGHRLTGANLGNGQYPNTYQGWGEPNLSEVLDFGGARTLIATDVSSGNGFTSASNPNDTVTFTVDGSAERLRVTLVWTDEPGSAGQGVKLINNLDLRVTAPGGALYRGNVINGTSGESTTGGSADTLNNVENVLLSNPGAGAWTATIDPGLGNYAVGQGYALVITGDVSEGGGGGPSAPTAQFSGTPLSGEAPLLVNFSDLSTGTIDTWAWDFGDTSTSNAQNPSHTYTSPGTYTVSLTVTGPGGTDGETKVDYVTADPPPTGGGGLYYISFLSSTAVPGVGTVRDEDVVTYDPSADTWALYFDGSDVGATGDVNAVHVLADGDLVLSFNAPVSLSGLSGGPSGTSIDDSDLVIFDFTSSGSSTAGTFVFVFDGSDVGLTSNGEDVDGVYEFPAGGLGISTVGGNSVPGVGGRDEDVLFFNATQFGSVTTGTWSMYFDGSDVGFANSGGEDLQGITFENGNDLLFSSVGSWSASGGSGQDEDVGRFSGTFGSSTSGSASLELDLSALGISTSEDIDGLCFVP